MPFFAYPFIHNIKYDFKLIVTIVITIVFLLGSVMVWIAVPDSPVYGTYLYDDYSIIDGIFLTIIILLFLVYNSSVDYNFYKKVFFFFIIMTYGFLVEEIARIIKVAISPVVMEGLYPTQFIVVYIITNLFLFYPMMRLIGTINRLFSRENNDEIWKRVCLIPIFFMLFLIIIYDIPYVLQTVLTISQFQVLIIIPITIFIIACLVVLFKVLEYNQVRTEQEVRFNVLLNNYRDRIFRLKQLREMRHEMKHTIGALKILINNQEYDKAMEYLNKYSNDFDNILKIDFSNNILNSILSDYHSRFENNGIENKIDIEIAPNFTMNEMDLVEILTNMLDNALEASLKLPRNERKLHLKMKQNGNFIFLNVLIPINPIVSDK